MRNILLAAAVGASAAAAATLALLSLRRKREDHQALRSQVGRWEDEGGNVPQVPTPSPAPVPQSSVPEERGAAEQR